MFIKNYEEHTHSPLDDEKQVQEVSLGLQEKMQSCYSIQITAN